MSHPDGLDYRALVLLAKPRYISRELGCNDCHSISASTDLGNGSYVLTPIELGGPQSMVCELTDQLATG